MSFPAIIRPEVGQSLITKVTRLFNNTAFDVICLCGITSHAFS
jgi:hypothetical protein